MDGLRQDSVARGLLTGLDALLALLAVVAVVQAGPGRNLAAGAAAVVLLACYAAGRRAVRVHDRPVDGPRGRWWPDGAWILATTATWTALLAVAPEALWIAFPLMLLQMHVLGARWGVPAVTVTTAVAVTAGLLRSDDGTWLGFVLGPGLGAAVAVGVVLGLEAIVRESQARQRALDELRRARRELDRAERESAVAVERERLAREIHDTLAQSLSAIELLLRTADDAVGTDDAHAHTLIAQSRDAAASSLAEARRFVRDLTPTDLDGTTLLAALQRVAARTTDMAEEASGRAGSLRVDVVATGEGRPLPVPVETALLRIAQSALANVVQHAEASRVRVTLAFGAAAEAQDADVTLEIVDDGRGLDPSAGGDSSGRNARGFGLPGMRSRARDLGGTFAVDGAPGRGTTVRVAVPGTAPGSVPDPAQDVVPDAGPDPARDEGIAP